MSPIITPGPSIPSIPIDRTIERFGQIQKLIFQRKFQDGTILNELVALTASPALKATWTPLLASTTGTKVTGSPFISEPANEAGEARTYGGGNATVNGIPIVLGQAASPFTALILESKQHVIRELKKLEAEGTNLAVYLVNEHGHIGLLNDGLPTPLKYRPIPIYSLFVGEKVFGNFEGVDNNALQFMFEPGFSLNFDIIVPTDFNPLNDLVNPV